jgi:catechol 2,3-dioxygenase-like lactoylglutathione lyase family enzyme
MGGLLGESVGGRVAGAGQVLGQVEHRPHGDGGTGLGMMPEAQTQFIQAVVDDADAALAYLRDRDVECEGVDEQAWGRFVYFQDPDGNKWALQQIVRPG